MFCKVQGYEEYGIGKIEQIKGKECVVSYFSSPISDNIEVTVNKTSVQIISLDQQTRIYWQDEDTSSWKVGRVLDGEGEEIYVQFPNKDIRNIPVKDAFVRWDKPIPDPTPYLSNFINETPLYAMARAKFLQSYMSQRHVSNGMSGLLSSSIELEEHQFGVVRNVLLDPVQRYLLADEVGLGKTIEAGVLIRQHILDNPKNAEVVVLVPTSLGRQWVAELKKRFHLQPYLGQGLNIVSYDIDAKEELLQLQDLLSTCTMLVIDEVHNIVEEVGSDNETPLYKIIKEACRDIEGLLLLSATPVLGNEHGFLAMLHLLDPTMYPLDSVNDFKKKINNRQELAQIVAQFQPENVFFLEDSLDQLNEIFPDDKILEELSNNLKNILEEFPEPEDENLVIAISNLRAHISETYKLHRRILRNRRSRVQGLTPDRIGMQKWSYDAPDYQAIIERLDEWRTESFTHSYDDAIKKHRFEELFSVFLDALFCDINIFIAAVSNRLNNPDKTIPLYDNEKSILEDILSIGKLIVSEDTKPKHLAQNIQSILGEKNKVVIFCSTVETADNLYDYFLKIFNTNVVRHSTSDSSWHDFLKVDTCTILICDSSSEEGLNLQGGKKCIIHYDLPLSPNRVEQRLGRLDRYGSGRDIINYCLVANQNTYEQDWYECLNQGFKVFNRSIASLQYLIKDKMIELQRLVFSDGIDCFKEFTPSLHGDAENPGILDQELKRIEIQDSLDEMHQSCEQLLYDLEDVDEEWEQIESDTSEWVEKCLMFDKVPHQVPPPFPPDRVFRYQYSYGRRRNTLFPINDFLVNFLPTIDRNAPNSTARTPKSFPFSFRRQTSVSKEVALLRYGARFLQGIHDFTQKDDRGKSFALWRFVPDYQTSSVADIYFRFDYLIEIDPEPFLQIIATVPQELMRVSSSNIKRQGDMLFSPFIRTVWLDSDKQPVDKTKIISLLEIGYSKRPRENGIYDTNLRQERWDIVKKLEIPEIDYWAPLCSDIRIASEEYLKNVSNLSELCEESVREAKRNDLVHFTQMTARLAQLTNDEARIENERVGIEKRLREALYEGTLKPKITLDSIGTVLLSRVPLQKH